MGVLTWPGDQFEVCVDGYLVKLVRAVTNEERIKITEDMVDSAMDIMVDCGEIATPPTDTMVEMEMEAGGDGDGGDYWEEDGW